MKMSDLNSGQGGMQLGVKERIALIGLLPKRGNVDTVKMSAMLNVALAIKPEEAEAIEFKIDGRQANWNAEKEAELPPKVFPLSAQAKRFVVGILKRMNKAKEISFESLGLWMRFVEQK